MRSFLLSESGGMFKVDSMSQQRISQLLVQTLHAKRCTDSSSRILDSLSQKVAKSMRLRRYLLVQNRVICSGQWVVYYYK